MSFTDEDETALINIVRNYPILYNTDHRKYRNKHLKEKTWQAIADRLDKPKEECKRRWKFIRDGYQRFKKKHPVESEVSPSLSKVNRHNKLMFLDEVFKPRQHHGQREAREKTTDNCDVYTSEGNDPIGIKEEMVTVPVSFTEEDPEFFGDELEEYDEEQTDDNELEDQGYSHQIIQPIKSKKRQPTREPPSAIEKKDDVEYFCLHLAEVLRKLPPIEKAKAKKHLNEVLSDYEILAAKLAFETPTTSTSTG